MNRISLLGIILLLLFGCSSPESKWVELFNGENFEGWHTFNIGKVYDGWYVENEELRFDFKLRKQEGSSYLVSDKTYTNFELSLEWKISEHGNSGIFWSVLE
ncbi:MAG: DUF1080 domain-containing protein, partial [Winogradskyella sp.]|nr:DUF1080 domain-containing protein [Winogradskyella sp.]